MQVEALKIFCDVARLRSFSRGAAANDVLQSAASQTVSQLEKQLGVTLIDRTRRPWKLTAEGKTFYDGSSAIVDRYFALEAAVKHIHTERDAVVRVAAIYSVGLGDMSHCVHEFARQHIGVSVRVEYLHPDRVFERVLEGQADFGIVSFPPARRDLEVIPWRREPMVLVCPPSHRLARAKLIKPSELAGEKFVAFERGLGIRKEVDRYLKNNNIRIETAMEFDNIEAIKRAVEIGSGVSLLPRPTLDHEVETGTLVAVSLAGKEFARPLGIIHRRGRKLYPNALQFIERLQGNHSHEDKS